MENNVVELQDLDDELDMIDKELSKLKQRLNACLKYKRDELKGRITKLTEQVDAEQKAIIMAKNHNWNRESPKTKTKNKTKKKDRSRKTMKKPQISVSDREKSPEIIDKTQTNTIVAPPKFVDRPSWVHGVNGIPLPNMWRGPCTKTHREVKGNLKSALENLRKNHEIMNNLPNEVKKQKKVSKTD